MTKQDFSSRDSYSRTFPRQIEFNELDDSGLPLVLQRRSEAASYR